MTSRLVAGRAAFRTMVAPVSRIAFDDGGAVAGVEPAGGHPRVTQTVRKEGSAGGHRVGDDELLEHRVLHEFEGGHGPHRAGAQHQDFHKLLFSLLARHSVWLQAPCPASALRPRPRR